MGDWKIDKNGKSYYESQNGEWGTTRDYGNNGGGLGGCFAALIFEPIFAIFDLLKKGGCLVVAGVLFTCCVLPGLIGACNSKPTTKAPTDPAKKPQGLQPDTDSLEDASVEARDPKASLPVLARDVNSIVTDEDGIDHRLYAYLSSDEALVDGRAFEPPAPSCASEGIGLALSGPGSLR